MGKELKEIGFAALVCLVCGLCLAIVYSGLKSEQDRNKTLDMRVKVLTAIGVGIANDKGKVIKTAEEIEEIFSANIQETVLDGSGTPLDVKIVDLTDAQINVRTEDGLKEYYPLYVYTNPESGKKRYAIHISGRGLWSVIKGYLALEEDLSTIAGVAFYEHQETPGLGGEIEKDFFQDSFKGKTFMEAGELKEFKIIKPGSKGDNHCVDGITAATMTCNGVSVFLNSDFAVYNKYFAKLRK